MRRRASLARRRSLTPGSVLVLICAPLMLAAVSEGSQGAVAKRRSRHVSRTAPPRAIPMPGPVGPAGPPGQVGPAGPAGPKGPDSSVQSISIDWQDGYYQGHDVATFEVPGIGEGEVKCSPDTQWIRLIPSDAGADAEMWAAIMRENKVAVRAAARRSADWGPDFYLGLNQRTVTSEEPQAHGQMRGIISTRGPFGAAAPASLPAPATFSLSWYWSFADRYGPRCYVSGVVIEVN